ncbi:hypothetical protein NDU88_005068 [Pleurodeles waltl]|uniref:Uncharacterized protein n=1 Tax=Pleurodeles waltl TaxID=8319 RepID=A0AAV7MVB1_PLEWA|nr:hypothetical protein NDU88_005068 [Pleurodeles waltl]
MPRGYVPRRPRPRGTSGASFPDQEVFCLAPRNAEKLNGAGTFKAPEEEERRQNQTTMEEPTATLEKEKATLQPNFGRMRQQDAEASHALGRALLRLLFEAQEGDRPRVNSVPQPPGRGPVPVRGSIGTGPPEELQLNFTVAGGRGAEHCALPSGPRKN